MAKQVYLLGILLGFTTLWNCGDGTQAPGKQVGLFDIVLVNNSPDTLFGFPFEVDLVRVNDQFELKHGDEMVPVQIEDRNENGTPDKMVAMIDLAPGNLKKITAFPATGQKAATLVNLHARIDGSDVGRNYTYAAGDSWDGDGIIMDNEWFGIRYLMKPPFPFDIIGKKKADLLTAEQTKDLSKMAAWGGAALGENGSLGLGSPAVFDQDQIVSFAVFDTKEVNIISSGPLRAEVQIITRGVPVRDEKVDFMIKWQLVGGKQWSEVEVTILSKTNLNLQMAFGLPKHPDATDFTQGLVSNVHFAYTFGLQDIGGEQLGMAILVPGKYEVDTYRDDPKNYFYLVTPIDQKVQYRMLASWGKGREIIIDEVDFINLTKETCAQYGAAVQIKPDFRLQ
jgi:hypothetical protein